MKKIFLLLVFIILPFKVSAISARSYVLMEEDTKRVLASKNMNEKMLIASTTKIMTAIIALESNKINNYVIVNDNVLKAYGSCIYISIGEKILLKDLIYGLLLRSGNDAAIAIADYLGGYENFVNKMNKKAKEIGMKNTIFNNPSGLDEETKNYSTSYDMALLMRYANSISLFKKISSTKKYKLKTNKNTYIWKNKNKLLFSYKYTTGGKTGYTDKAKRTLVTSASKNNLNLIVVTLNAPDDFKDHMNLYEYGFNNYTMKKVFDKKLFNLKKSYVLDDYYYPLTKNENELISFDYEIKNKDTFKKNEFKGNVLVKFNGKIIHKEKIYAK